MSQLLNCSVSVVYWRSEPALLTLQAFPALHAELCQVTPPVRHVQHPFAQPPLPPLESACCQVIVMKRVVVTVVISLDGSGSRSAGFVDHSDHLLRRTENTIGV